MHMTRDREKIVTFQKERDGTILFRNDSSTKILGKGTINIGIKDSVAKNVLLIENMNQNFLSVSQMCDQGHTLLYNSRKCKIRKINHVD